jgi:hypothetical protein
MPTSASDRYVTLRGGLTVPLEPVLLVLDLEARGLTLRRDGDDLVIQPRAQLTDTDRAKLRRWKPHVLALIDDVEAIG